MRRTHAMLIGMAILAGCNDPGFRGVPGVRIAGSAADVAACAYDADLSARPGVFGPVVGPQAVAYARNQVLALAQDGGADTVLFEQVPPGTPVYEVRARSYRCAA